MKLAIETSPAPADEQVVWRGLHQHNDEYVPATGDATFAVFLRGHDAYLDTFSFQARPFYERCGYEVFGTLEDFPTGHQRFFMRKSLQQ